MKLRHSLLALALMSALPFATFAATANEAELTRARAELRTAREELRDVTKRIAELSAQLGEGSPQAFAFRYLNEPRRAMVGIVMVPDDKGIRIGAVTPGGPAAKAGVRADDVLTAINGKAVALGNGKDRDSTIKSARELLADLEEGQTVKLSVLRQGKTQQFELKAERRESWDWAGMLESMPDLGAALAPLAKMHEIGDGKEIEIIINGKRQNIPHPPGGNGTHVFEWKSEDHDGHHSERIERIVKRFGDGAPWASLNLSTLNPELGRYFGADHGVLVLDSSASALKELKPGDVIQIVDAQPADSVSGVMRALSRKEPGQTINVEVWRDRKRQVLAVTVPERDQFMFSLPPTPPVPPTPPTAPVAPRAPKGAMPGLAPPAPPATPSAPTPPTPPAVPRTPKVSTPGLAPAAAPAAPSAPTLPALPAVPNEQMAAYAA